MRLTSSPYSLIKSVRPGLLFSGWSRRIVQNDRELRRAGAQPQLGTRPGHQVLARHRFLQTSHAPVHLEALPKDACVVLSLQPLHVSATGRHVPARGIDPPDGTRSPPAISPV